MNFNQVNLAGHLTKDPELSYTQNQTAVVNFDIAINYRSGQREETCFVHCSAFGNVGETIAKYLTKGSPIFVTGRLHQQKWQARDGSNRTKMEVIVSQFRFIGGSNSSGGASVEAPTINETKRAQKPDVVDDDVFK